MATVPTHIETVILDVSHSLGVDPYLAIATAQQESALNPRAVGDHGTSFGLFQLHEGGELGDLTEEQAFNPRTNATVALTEVAKVADAHPEWSPGHVAAAAQRPADQVDYANAVNHRYTLLCSPLHTRLFRPLREVEPMLRGADIAALQRRLHITPDGLFGSATRSAVTLLQREAPHLNLHGKDIVVTVDGIVGPQTCAVLGWTYDAP
jgi:hypothetical protein